MARGEGLQGATVLKGFRGLDHEGHLLEEHLWHLSQTLPAIVEVVDSRHASRRCWPRSSLFSARV